MEKMTEEEKIKVRAIMDVIDDAIRKIDPKIHEGLTAIILLTVHYANHFKVSKPIILNYISEAFEENEEDEDETDFSDEEYTEW